jgi:rubrerythrin
MEAGNDPLAVIEALAEHEETLGALYAAYADLYPAAQALWRTLSDEEHGHATLLRSLPNQTNELASFIDARRFQLEEVRAETVRLRSVVRTAPFAGMDLLGAFRLALKLEDSLIESQVFIVSEGDAPAVAAVLTRLAEATEGHRKHLSESFAGKVSPAQAQGDE